MAGPLYVPKTVFATIEAGSAAMPFFVSSPIKDSFAMSRMLNSRSPPVPSMGIGSSPRLIRFWIMACEQAEAMEA